MSKSRWFSAAIFMHRTKVLVIRYWNDVKSTSPVQVKFPGGQEKKNGSRYDRNPEETLLAEIAEEVMSPGAESPRFQWALVHKKEFPGHGKYFYLVKPIPPILLREGLRTERMEEIEDDDRREVIEPPEWMEVDDLAKVIFPSHALALKELCIQILAMNGDDLDGRFSGALHTLKDRERRNWR